MMRQRSYSERQGQLVRRRTFRDAQAVHNARQDSFSPLIKLQQIGGRGHCSPSFVAGCTTKVLIFEFFKKISGAVMICSLQPRVPVPTRPVQSEELLVVRVTEESGVPANSRCTGTAAQWGLASWRGAGDCCQAEHDISRFDNALPRRSCKPNAFTSLVANIRKSPLRGRTDTVPSVAACRASDAGGVGWRSTEITCAGATENGTLGYRVDVHGSDSAIRIRCGASQGERRTFTLSFCSHRCYTRTLTAVVRRMSRQSMWRVPIVPVMGHEFRGLLLWRMLFAAFVGIPYAARAVVTKKHTSATRIDK